MNAEKGLKNNDLIIGGIITVLILLFGHLGFLVPLYSVASQLFDSIQSSNYELFTELKGDWSFLADLAGIKEDLNKYKTENEFYKVENERLKLEIDSLNKLVEQGSFDLSYELIPVRVLLYTNEQSAIVINKGEAQNIHVGDTLVLNNNYIGRVAKTYQSKALIELVSSPSSRIPVYISVDNLKGFLSGQGGGQLLLQDVPNERFLTKGAIIITSGADLKIPFGLIVGKVSEILSDQTDIVQKAYIEPLVPINQLTEAYILKTDESTEL